MRRRRGRGRGGKRSVGMGEGGGFVRGGGRRLLGTGRWYGGKREVDARKGEVMGEGKDMSVIDLDLIASWRSVCDGHCMRTGKTHDSSSPYSHR